MDPRKEQIISDEEQLILQDKLGDALRIFAGVEQALGHVGEESTDYCMCQMLSNVLHAEIAKVFAVLTEGWKCEAFVY